MKRALSVLLSVMPACCFAQPGITEMQQARQDLSASFFSAFDCSLVIAGLLGILGAGRIFYNWQMGRDQITAQLLGWFSAAIFVILAGAFLSGMFGI